MRKCRSCGSLLLGDADACPRCGAPLVAVAAGAAIAARAPAPPEPASPPPRPVPTIWTPPPTSAAPAGPAAPVVDGSPQPLPALRESWQPIAMPPVPDGQPRSTRLGIIALVVAVALLGGLGVMHLRSDPLPKGTSSFVAGGGVTYSSADGAFQVQLPQTPVLDQRNAVLDGTTVTIFSAQASTDDYVIGAASISFSSTVAAARVNGMLEAALTDGVNGSNGKLVEKDLTTHGSLPAIEGKFNASDGYSAHLLVVASGSTLVMLIVHAKSGTERLYKALEDSLIVR